MSFGFSSGFGASQASPFGATNQQSAPAFGQQQNPSPFGGGGFGQAAAPASTPFGGGAGGGTSFGAAPATGGFGAPQTGFGQSSAPTSAFGGGGSAFGANPATTGFGFGQSSASNTFGGAPSTSAFGGSATTGFGSTASPSPFGAGSQSSAFGQQTPTPFGRGATTGFGAQSQPSAFGAASTGTGAFGGGGAFGGSPVGGAFGQPGGMQQQNRGTRAVAWRKTQEVDQSSTGARSTIHFNSISCMPEYVSKSVEELRWEDYQDGNKGGSQAMGSGGSMFGQSQPAQSNPFGQPASQPASSPFGGTQTPAFGGSAFGSTAPATGGAFGAASSTPSFGGFGSTAPSSAPAFGGGGFGASSTPAFGSTSLGTTAPAAFGAPQQSQPAFGLSTAASTPAFGASTSTTSTFGGFGANSAPSFGAASTPAFGAASSSAPAFGSTQTTTNLFGGAASTPASSFAPAQSTPGFGFQASTPKPATSSFSFGGGASTPSFGLTNTAGAGATPGFSIPNSTPAFGGSGLFSGGTNTGISSPQPASTPAFSLGGAMPTSGIFGAGAAGGTTNTQQAATPVGPSSPYGNMPEPPKVTPLPEYKVGLTQRILVPPSAGPPKPVALITPRSLTPHGGGKLRPRISVSATRMSKSPAEFFASSTLHGTPVGRTATPAAEGSIFVPRDDPRRLLIRDELPPTSGKKSTTGKTPRTTNVDSPGMNGFHSGSPSPSPTLLTLKSLSPQTTGGKSPMRDIVSVLPVLEREEYFIEPSMTQLTAMAQEDIDSLSSVANFTVGKEGVGSVRWLDPVDIRGLELDSIITLAKGSIDVYPEASVKPPVGQSLNCPAVVTMLKVFKIDKATGKPTKDPEVVEKYMRKLKRVCAEQGAKFISYDGVTGEWKFEVEHFSRYGLDDSSDDDDESAPVKGGATALHTMETDDSDASDVSDMSDDVQLGLKSHWNRNVIVGEVPGSQQSFPSMQAASEDLLRLRSSFGNVFPSVQQHSDRDVDEESEDDDALPICNWKRAPHNGGLLPPLHPKSQDADLPKNALTRSANVVICRNLADFGALMCKSFGSGWGAHETLCSPLIDGNERKILIKSGVPIVSASDREFLLKQLTLHYSHSFPADDSSPDCTPRLRLQCSREVRHLQKLTMQYMETCQEILRSSPEQTSKTLPLARKAEAEVWDLVNVLFSNVPADDHIPIEDESDDSDVGSLQSLAMMQRRAAFSVWLQDRTRGSIKQQLKQLDGLPGKETEKLLVLLSGHDLESAVITSVACGNVRLATLLASAGKLTPGVNSISEQHQVWKDAGYFDHIEKGLLEVYDILGGNVDTSMHIVKNDWKRALGMHLWYVTPNTAPVSSSVASYLGAVQDGRAPFPSAWHGVKIPGRADGPADTAFELVRMFCQSEEWETEDEKTAAALEALPDLLCPLGLTPDPQDAGFFWHLFCVLESIGVVPEDLSEEAEAAVARITTTYISQLEAIGGLAHWAIYVALHIKDESMRDHIVRDLLCRYCSEWQDDDDVVEFLVHKIGVPVAMLEEAKAIWARYNGDYDSVLESLLDAGDWDAAHSILTTKVAPKWFLARDPAKQEYVMHESLLGALEEIEQHQSNIDLKSWELGAGLYLDFFRLKDSLMQSDQLLEDDILAIQSLACRVDDAYLEASRESNKDTMLQKAAYSAISGELSRWTLGGFVSDGLLPLRHGAIQSRAATVAQVLLDS